MKYLILLLCAMNVQANSLEDYKFVEVSKMAEKIESEMFNSRHENVSVKAFRMSLSYLNSITSKEVQSGFSQQLAPQSISELFSCYHSSDCDVYRIKITGSYHSGWSESVDYILFKDNLDVKVISQDIYGE